MTVHRLATEGLICRAYERVSTDEQSLHGYSLDAQRERLEQFAQSQGWSIVQHYREEGASGKDLNRPRLQRLLADSEPGQVILVYKLDRLTRSVLDLHKLLLIFDQRGLLFKSATEEFNTTTSSGRLMITLVAAIAQWERETISERVAEGLRKKVTSREWPGGPIPFGYVGQPGETVKKGRRLLQVAVDPTTAHIVVEAYDRYLAGQGVRRIRRWLNEEKQVLTMKGNPWKDNSVVRMLTNPIYCGDLVHGRRSPKAETHLERDVIAPIIPLAKWAAVQELFQQRKGMAPRHATGGSLLAGVARCGICGQALVSAPRRREGLRYYRCLGYVHGPGCGGGGRGQSLASVPAGSLEERVVALLHTLVAPAALTTLFRRFEEEGQRGCAVALSERKRVEAELSRVERAIARWDQAYAAGKLELDDYVARVKPLQERREVLKAQLATAAATSGPPKPLQPVRGAMHFKLAWEQLTAAERKALLHHFVRAFGVQISVHKGGEITVVPVSGPGIEAGIQ